MSVKEILRQAQSFHRKGHYNKAIEIYSTIIAEIPDYFVAWADLGLAYCQIGDLKKGINILEKALKLKPNNALTWQHLGFAYFQDGQIKKSEEAFKQYNYLKSMTKKLTYSKCPECGGSLIERPMPIIQKEGVGPTFAQQYISSHSVIFEIICKSCGLVLEQTVKKI
ncbi:MAG: tetratricopeptide repeat protein [Candidatus Odinarchaeia archaeon]